MNSIDIEVLPTDCSNHEQPATVDLPKRSKSIPAQVGLAAMVGGAVNRATVPTPRYTSVIPHQSYFASVFDIRISNSVKRACMFAVFTSIAMVTGILIVYFTSPKPPGKTCTFILKSEARSSISGDSHPHSVAVGDFNNDGRPDLVVPNSGTNNIGVFLRHGNSTFTDQITYSTGAGSLPYAVAVGYFNNDQRLDIIVANFGTNSIGVFLGTGNGNFASQNTFSTGSSRPRWVAVGDFNNDTLLDIIMVNYGTNTIGVLLGDGHGNFANQITFYTGFDSIPYSLAVGDFNNDHKLDIAAANYGTDIVGVYLGLGNGTFASQAILNLGMGSHPSSIVIGDLNNDTHLDIVVACPGTNSIDVLLGFGNGTFAMITKYSTGNDSSPLSVAIGDFDNDNKLDIAVADYGTDSVGVLFGHGNGLFSDQITFFTSSDSNPYSIATGDFNNDTRLDLAVVNYDYNYVDIILTYRNYSFSNQTTYPTTGIDSNPISVAVADFNNDSRLDFVVANFGSNNIDVFLGFGDGNFADQISYSTGDYSAPNAVTTGDFNNDKRVDLVVANSGSDNIGVFLGNGNGTFSSQITCFTGNHSQPSSIAVGNINNDNYLDIVIANYGISNIGIFLGNGDGTFSSQRTYSTGLNSGPLFVVVGNFNNDSYLDIAVVNYQTNSLGIFLGNGNSTFSNQTAYSVSFGNGAFSAAVGDLNNDGHLDIVVTIMYGSAIDIYFGQSNGTFISAGKYSTGSASRPASVAIGDWNNDDRLDIAVANCITDNVLLFVGDGDGTFSNERTYPTGNNSCSCSVASGDFNSDGLLDIVVANYNTDMVGVFLGSTYMNGLLENTYSTGSSPRPQSIALGDFNDDARLDIAIANYGLGNVGVLLAYTNGSFPFQMLISTGALSFPTSVAVGHFNNDSELDLTVANSGTDSVSILFGFGNGNFASAETYPIGFGSIPQCVVVGDFNNDKKDDIVVANSGADSVFTLVKYDIGAFRKQVSYFTGTDSTPRSVSVGDFNNDGWLDFVVVNPGNNCIDVFLGFDSGTFSTPTTYATGNPSNPWSTVVADFNNDSYLDIVVSNTYGDNIGVFLGHGDGTFSNQTTYSTGSGSEPVGVAVADFSNDSRLDIVVTLESTGQIGILLGFGNGSFSNVTTYSTGNSSYPVSVSTGDFNNDNRLDIVVASYGSGNIVIFHGYGDGNFSYVMTYSTGTNSYTTSVAAADFNNDGILDIAVANSGADNIGVFFGNGNDTFSNQTTFSTGSGSAPHGIVVGDFNNDNQLDIAVADYGSNNLGILLGCINGTFFSQLTYATGDSSQPFDLAIGDFNNDSRLDVVVSNVGTDDVDVFLGYANESFVSAPAYSTGSSSQPTSIAVGDFNNDTRLDVVVANNGTDNVMILFGSGYGTFISQTIYSTGNGSQPCWVAVGDFNNDNQLDVVVANSGTNSIGVFLSNGSGTFPTQMIYSTGVRSQPYSVAVVDFNNDTRLDIAVASYGANSVGVFFGFGNGSFMNQLIFPTGYGSHPFALAIGDVNNDKLTDIVATNNGYGNIDILMKTC